MPVVAPRACYAVTMHRTSRNQDHAAGDVVAPRACYAVTMQQRSRASHTPISNALTI